MVAPVPPQIKAPSRLPAPPSLRSLPVVTTHHLLPPVFRPPLCFHALTNPSSRKPFIFTSIQIPGGCGGTSLQSPSQLVLCGKSIVFRYLPPLFPLFALFSALPPFVFNRLRPLFLKHPGGGYLDPRTGRLFDAQNVRQPSATWTWAAHPTIITASSRFQVHG